MRNILILFILLFSSKGFSQQPIYATISGGDLYSFDLANCTRHFIGSTGQGFGDIALTPNGNIWGIINGQLYNVDTSNANTTLIGTVQVQGNNLVALNDSILLLESGLDLYGLNNNNLSSYLIGNIGFGANGDLTWYDDDLYMVTSGGQIIRMVLNSTYTAILNVTQIGTAIPTCEGAVTASFTGDYNSIVGFNGPNLIKVCQIDGTYEALCPNLNVGGTPGGASIRLATQVPQPTFCDLTGLQDNLSNQLFSIFPNPANSRLNIQTNYNKKFDFKIYNTFGQLVKAGNFIDDSTTIYINELINGNYAIELSDGITTELKHFIVER